MERPDISKASPISKDQSVEEAFIAIIRHNLNYVIAWEPLALEGVDIEGVHQVRVGYRRMRSTLSVFRRALPREVTEALGQEMRWAAGNLGAARDVDVFIDEALDVMAGKVPLSHGEERLRHYAKAYQESSYEQVRETLESERYRRFKAHLDAWLKERTWRKGIADEKKMERLDDAITPFAIKVLEKRMSRVMGDGEEIDRLSTEELHQLRIDCKKLRYATEFFAPLFEEKGVSRFIKEMKQVQDLLGVLNDVAVLPGLLNDILRGVDDLSAQSYAGAALGWRAHEFESIIGSLPERWGGFVAIPLPWDQPRKRSGKKQ
uniref:CHAD domain-containing protein n=1 Tax=Magnetococcus massalia (strain MO-1) TaxID=451514 RepID=A0A1S7LMK6_MAGMO|nr:Protein of unknown function. putative CHAD domain containing protein [Candidatus Magnetococcus massalia]